jgi:hypothetical protein
MALLVDAANEFLTLDTSNYQKSLSPITNSSVRRRERQGAGLKASAAAAAAVKPPAMANSKTLQAPAAGKVKGEPRPAKPAQEIAEKASSSGAAKKAAPPLKRGGSSGIMQAFSKAATKATKPKKEAETPQLATPSGEDPAVQPLSDDGEEEEELPQPKPRSVSGLKSKKQREEELRKMMEEDDEEEEEVSEKEETPEDEPMEEEPPAAEPVKEEEKEVVTASTNGRRRGRRRVMRKKQIMDDQGYLGMSPALIPAWLVQTNSGSQSPFRRQAGSPSRRMSLPRPANRRQLAQPPRRRPRSQRKAGRKGARAVLCPSFPRSSRAGFARRLAGLLTVIRGSIPLDGSVQHHDCPPITRASQKLNRTQK